MRRDSRRHRLEPRSQCARFPVLRGAMVDLPIPTNKRPALISRMDTTQAIMFDAVPEPDRVGAAPEGFPYETR